MKPIRRIWPLLTIIVVSSLAHAAQSQGQEIADGGTILGMLQGYSAKAALDLCDVQQLKEDYAEMMKKESEKKERALNSKVAGLRIKVERYRPGQPRILPTEEKKHNQQGQKQGLLRRRIEEQDRAIRSILDKRKMGYAYIQNPPEGSTLLSPLNNSFALSVARYGKPGRGFDHELPH